MQKHLKQRNPNPLFQKFLDEGSKPTTYITPEKRQQIYNYLSRQVNFQLKSPPQCNPYLFINLTTAEKK
jgi:hypothetical protein